MSAVAEHEARHAAAGLLLGLDLAEAGVGTDGSGWVRPSWQRLDVGDPDIARKTAMMVLVGPLGDEHWPPAWPSKSADTKDEQQLALLAARLGLDESGWNGLVTEAWQLASTREFELLEHALEHLLAQGHKLDRSTLDRVKRIAEEAGMEHKQLAVVDSTALNDGEMLAIASTWDTDKQGDRVIMGAFARSVEQIKAGATVPLIWAHDANSSPQNWVGEIIDADETAEGLEVLARFDLEDPVAIKAYRLVKTGAIEALSIGYQVRSERRARDRVNELTDIDLKEVSLVMQPANEHARVLAIKADDPPEPVPSHAELQRRLYAEGLISRPLGETYESEGVDLHDAFAGSNGDNPENGEKALDPSRRRTRAAMLAILTATDTATKAASVETKSDQPIVVATFDCG